MFYLSVWSVCVSVNEVPAIYLVYNIMMKDRFYYHIDFNICIEWISLKTLYLKVLASLILLTTSTGVAIVLIT